MNTEGKVHGFLLLTVSSSVVMSIPVHTYVCVFLCACMCMCACFCVHVCACTCVCVCVCVYVHMCKYFFRTNTESSKHSCGMKGPACRLPAQTCGGQGQRGGPEPLKAEQRGEHPQKEAGPKVQRPGDQGEWGELASRWGLTQEKHTVSRHHSADNHMGPET